MSAECSLGIYRHLGPSRHTKKEKKHEQYYSVQLIFCPGASVQALYSEERVSLDGLLRIVNVGCIFQ